MQNGKKLLVALLAAVIFTAVAVGTFLFVQSHVFIGMKAYPNNTAQLDLREEQLSVDHYLSLKQKLPETEILWAIPMQGGRYAQDIRELSVETLSEADFPAIACMTQLQSVQAETCTDYAVLQKLQQTFPQLTVNYLVTINGQPNTPKTQTIYVTGVTQEELSLLQYLPELQNVVATGCDNLEDLKNLQAYCRKENLGFALSFGGEQFDSEVTELTAQNVQEQELALLELLPNLTSIHFLNPEASPEALLELQKNRSEKVVSWEVEIQGERFSWDTEEVDLSCVEIDDLSQVENAMGYLPNAKKLILGFFETPEEGLGEDPPEVSEMKKAKNGDKYVSDTQGIDNQQLSDYRDRVRDQYLVVWWVHMGKRLNARTDETSFRPDSQGTGRFFDDESYNLRYCEDMIAIDVGHMSVSDISFVAYMPHLKYLILAWTQVQYIDAISSCKELIFLELDWSCIRDYTPLLGCTALQDLNLGQTYADITPVLQMTWLKNLWMVFCSGSAIGKAGMALKDTHVVGTGNATVSSGWRNLPNYFDMRDALDMYYMSW